MDGWKCLGSRLLPSRGEGTGASHHEAVKTGWRSPDYQEREVVVVEWGEPLDVERLKTGEEETLSGVVNVEQK